MKDGFSFAIENLDPPGTPGFLTGLECAASVGFDAGMELEDIYNKFCLIIPEGSMSKKEIMSLIDPAIAHFPESQPDEEIEKPEAIIAPITEPQEKTIPEKSYDDQLADLRKQLMLATEKDEIEDLFWKIRKVKLLRKTVNVSDWLPQEPAPLDQILQDTADVGDKIAFIGPAKMKKSFFMLMFLICLAAGRNFLRWPVPKPRRVVLIQLEIQEAHFHRRVINIAKALGIDPEDLGDRFHVINCRGLGVEGPEGIELIGEVIKSYSPEVIGFDPFYKISAGAENAIEDNKKTLNGFDQLIEKTGAAVVYVHHDAKGQPGDRETRDRGSGSNVVGRDYDTGITLTPHATDTDAVVVEILVRNYKDQQSFTILWEADEATGSYCFTEHSDILPEKKTSRSRTQPPDLPTYLPIAASILANDQMEIALFKDAFKKKSGLSNSRISDFIAWATSGGNPYLTKINERGRGVHKTWIRLSRGLSNE